MTIFILDAAGILISRLTDDPVAASLLRKYSPGISHRVHPVILTDRRGKAR
jgi:hypothetical protein